MPDPVKGEVPKAWVVLKAGQSRTERRAARLLPRAACALQGAGAVEFRKDLPKTMVGKVLRRVLVEETKRAS